MRRDGVVVRDPSGDLSEDRVGIGAIRAAHVIPLERVYKGFCHAIRLWACSRCRDRDQVQPLGRADRVEGGIDRTVVAEKLNRRIRPRPSKPRDRGRAHELLNIVRVEIAGHGHPGEAFAIVAVQHEGDLDVLPIPARDLEPITAPPLVRDRTLDLPTVGATRATTRAPYVARVRTTSRICAVTTRSSAFTYRRPRGRSSRYDVARPIPSTRHTTARLRPVIAWTRRTSVAFF